MKPITQQLNGYTTIDRYSYEQAQRELDIKETALRDRIKAAGIVPHREGKTP